MAGQPEFQQQERRRTVSVQHLQRTRAYWGTWHTNGHPWKFLPAAQGWASSVHIRTFPDRNMSRNGIKQAKTFSINWLERVLTVALPHRQPQADGMGSASTIVLLSCPHLASRRLVGVPRTHKLLKQYGQPLGVCQDIAYTSEHPAALYQAFPSCAALHRSGIWQDPYRWLFPEASGSRGTTCSDTVQFRAVTETESAMRSILAWLRGIPCQGGHILGLSFRSRSGAS